MRRTPPYRSVGAVEVPLNEPGARPGLPRTLHVTRFRDGETVRFSRSSGVVLASVLTLATAVPAAADPLTDFHRQPVSWSPCDETKVGPLEGLPLECATLVAPVDYRNPAGDRLQVAISRLKATDPARRRGILLVNPGGPGAPGLGLPVQLGRQEIAQVYDLIGFDPRGVGQSTQLQCTVIDELPIKNQTRPADADFGVFTANAKAEDHACQEAGGALRPYINTNNTARDMDIIRAVLGEQRTNYLGYSYGTQLGATYGTLFPSRLDRSVLDSALDPAKSWHEQDFDSVDAIRANIDLWAEWVAARNNTFALGTSADAVKAAIEEIATALRTRSIAGMTEVSHLDYGIGFYTRYRESWASYANRMQFALIEVRQGIKAAPSVAEDLANASRIARERTVLHTQEKAGVTVKCEWNWPDPQTSYREMRRYRQAMPYGGVVPELMAPNPCAFRSFQRLQTPVRATRGYPVGLVVQADGDTQTAYPNGVAMATALGDTLISVRDDGNHGHYRYNDCVTKLVDGYLVRGVLPPSRSSCPPYAEAPDIPVDTRSSLVAPAIESLTAVASRIHP
ncbi:alpha/beta fold hydrolase [Pseudonocardiaceae bacterium YIM PH 21723]|nr:alpha/beta fold hydrolase [Pseudonocardiaceae bacterium YIM PH 21723]